jgi:TorA maturation chaperone TorD
MNLTASIDRGALPLAREVMYRFLAAALRDPREASFELIANQHNTQCVLHAAKLLQAAQGDEPLPLGVGELPPESLPGGDLLDAPQGGANAITAQYDEVFGFTMCRECPPFETEYCSNQEPFYRAQQMADIAGFYNAFGLKVSERPDYLPLQLEFMALLLTKQRLASQAAGERGEQVESGGGPIDERGRSGMSASAAQSDGRGAYRLLVEQSTVCAEAQKTFFRDHLLWWVPSFSLGLRSKAQRGFYAAAGKWLAAWWPLERAVFGLPPAPLPVLPVLSGQQDEEPSACGGCAAGTQAQ